MHGSGEKRLGNREGSKEHNPGTHAPRTHDRRARDTETRRHGAQDGSKNEGKPLRNIERAHGHGAQDTREQKPETGTTDRTETGPDMIEGRNPVLEALRSDRAINKIVVAKGDREGSIRQVMALARRKGIIVQEVDRTRLDSISATHAHQGVIAYASAKEYVGVDDILEAVRYSGELPFIIILDEITDTHNLGSILRTADAVGAHGVIIPKRRAAGLNSAVAKASAGAIEYVPVARVANIAQTIEYLKKQNIWVIGTDSTGEKPFYKADLKGPVALVVGSEGEGMGRLVRERCDFVVNIPMHGRISSLNAAVAAAIVMYEIAKQRGK